MANSTGVKRTPRIDLTFRAIRDALRRVGCSVWDTSHVGGGYPSLCVRTPDGFLLLLEVKSPRGTLTPDQERHFVYFPETAIATTVEEALRIVGVHSERQEPDARMIALKTCHAEGNDLGPDASPAIRRR